VIIVSWTKGLRPTKCLRVRTEREKESKTVKKIRLKKGAKLSGDLVASSNLNHIWAT
jgi:hypothetical protein